MDALKTSTKNLLTQLKSSASTDGDVYVSIIPFSRGINVGSSNYNANWIDWSEWESEPVYMATWLANTSNKSTWDQTGPGNSCPFSSSKTGFGCVSGPADNASTTNSVPSSGSYSGYVCPGTDTGGKDGTKAGFKYPGCYNSTTYSSTGSSATCTGHSNCSCSGSGSNKICKTNNGYFEHTWIKNARSTWTGCVADRGAATAPGTTAGNDQTATAPTTSDVKDPLSGSPGHLLPAGVDGIELQLDDDEFSSSIHCTPTAAPTSQSGLSRAGTRWSASVRSPLRRRIPITPIPTSSF